MAVLGDLTDFTVSDLLYLLTLRALTGRLALQRGADDVVLDLEQGRLVRVTATQGTQRLGELLVDRGTLTPDQLGLVLRLQTDRPGPAPVGALLVELGLVAPDDLGAVLTCQAEAILMRVLSWPDGTFAFTPAPASPGLPLPALNIERLTLEAIRQADEWAALQASLPAATAA